MTPKLKYKSFSFENDQLTILDQNKLPFEEVYVPLKDSKSIIQAIKDMNVRGAGLIGNIAAIGVYIAAKESNHHIEYIHKIGKDLIDSRPTAVNIQYAVQRMLNSIQNSMSIEETLLKTAIDICEEDRVASEKIGQFGVELIEEILQKKKTRTIQVLTHCNAGYLAIIDKGTALAPVYRAREKGYDVHVWVDETRPRNQGINLTSWELQKEKIPHTIIADNTGGLLMQKKMVDIVFVGADRVTKNGDVANKIGTYLKALAAHDNQVPFYVLFPSSTYDLSMESGDQITIEERDADEIKYVTGLNREQKLEKILITQANVQALNYGFDITPNRLISGWITETGVKRYS